MFFIHVFNVMFECHIVDAMFLIHVFNVMYINTVLFNVIITSLQEGHNKLFNKHHNKKIIRQKTIVKIL
jgi:hypothetical protein